MRSYESPIIEICDDTDIITTSAEVTPEKVDAPWQKNTTSYDTYNLD